MLQVILAIPQMANLKTLNLEVDQAAAERARRPVIDPTYTHGMWGREFTPTSVGLPKQTIELHLQLPQQAVVKTTSTSLWLLPLPM